MKVQQKVYIILVNYNRWQDTAECLESIFKLHYTSFCAIVVDNNSQDGSFNKLQEWAAGNLSISYNPHFYNRTGLPDYPVTKPLPFLSFESFQPEQVSTYGQEKKLVFIKSLKNLGFAGGNNLATKFALAQQDADYLWYLNNDTVVEENALTDLIHFSEKLKAGNEKVGIIGTKLLYYDDPETIQGLGGRYNKFSGLTSHVLANAKQSELEQDTPFTQELDYPIGASMLVTAGFIKEVGLMAEEYFLYFEELDWAERARQKKYKIISFLACRIYHKESASIGNSKAGKTKLADYYNLRNRILITKKFYKKYLPTVYLFFLPVILNRIIRKQFDRIPMIFKILTRCAN